MHVSRLEVTHWRGLTSTVLEFGDGITVVGGPNESGKTSLRSALSWALLMPTGVRGEKKVIEKSRPWDTKLYPKLQLDFTLNGESWSIEKEFLRPRDWASLRRGGRLVAQDEEAQRQVLLALGSTADWLEVLWGSQGKLGMDTALPESVKGRLAVAAQETIVPEVAELETLIESRYGEYWTAKRGLPTRKVQDVHDGVHRAERAVQDARDALETSNRLSADLSDGQGRLAALKVTRDAGEKQKREAQGRLGAWETYRLRVAEARAAEQALVRTRQWLQGWSSQVGQVQAVWPESQTWQEAVKAAQGKLGGRPSRAELEALGAREKYLVLLGQHEERARVESLPVPSEQMLGELQRADAELRDLDARLKMGEMRARLTADAVLNGVLVRDGVEESVSMQPADVQQWTALKSFALTVPGVGTLAVEAGTSAEDVSRRTGLQELFDKGVATFGARTLSELEQRVHEKKAGLKQVHKVDAGHLAAARTAVADAETLEALPADARKALLEALPAMREQAEAVWKGANDDYQATLAAYQKLNERNPVAKLSALLESMRAHVRMAPGEAGVTIPDEVGGTWVQELPALSAPWRRVVEQHEAEVRRLQALVLKPEGEEVTPAGIETLQTAVDASNTAIETLTREVERTIGALGAHGDLYARLVEAEETLQRAKAEQDRVWVDALAVKEVYNAFQAARQQLQKDVVAPLQERVSERFLTLAGPSYEGVAFDAALRVDGVVPSGRKVVSPEEISFGTREQLALLTRLCLAELLARDGERQLVVLDDNLVHTDGGRMRTACRMLEEAAERVQVVIFTCHPERYVFSGPVAQIEVGRGV